MLPPARYRFVGESVNALENENGYVCVEKLKEEEGDKKVVLSSGK